MSGDDAGAGGRSSVDSVLSSVASKASNAFSSVQVGVDSVFSRLREGDSVLDILSSGLDAIDAPHVRGLFRTQQDRLMLPIDAMALNLSVQNPVFRSYALCAGVLGAKLAANSAWTAYHRVTRKVFATQEDIVAFGGAAINNNDAVVERIRRMHLNDIENFTPFFILGLLYVTTEPDATEANVLFRLFVAARLLHTGFYVGKMQPGRLLACIGGWGVNAFMAYRVIKRMM